MKNKVELSKDYELIKFSWITDDSIVNVFTFDRRKGMALQSSQTLSVEIARSCWRDMINKGFKREPNDAGSI